jgi:hypothetical protein
VHPCRCPACPCPAGELEALQECTIGLGAGDQKEMLTRMLSKIAALESAVAAAEARRRNLHNQLVELKGNVSAGWMDAFLGRKGRACCCSVQCQPAGHPRDRHLTHTPLPPLCLACLPADPRILPHPPQPALRGAVPA